MSVDRANLTDADFLNWSWLGLDLKLITGDLDFGSDGDLLAHTQPIESFADVLKYKSQVAADRVANAQPYRIHNVIRAATNAIVNDPRVKSVKIEKGEWRVIDATVVPNVIDVRFYTVTVTVTLATGDVINNLVLPVFYSSE